MKRPSPEFHRPILVADLPEEGKTVKIAADAEERRALAERFALLGIDRLEADIELIPGEDGRTLAVEGRVRADVTQACVVTLEPLKARIDAPIRRAYAEGASAAEEGDLGPDLLDESDPPDPIVNGAVDLGEAVAEQLALELDPFPRKPGVEFQGAAKNMKKTKDLTDPDNPFAALAKLKQKR